MSDEHADGIGGESHPLFREIESLKFWAVAGAARALHDAAERGVDARQGLDWMMEALTPERIWERYLRYQEWDMEERVQSAIGEHLVVCKPSGRVWHKVFDDEWTWCGQEYGDGWKRGEPPLPLCEECAALRDREGALRRVTKARWKRMNARERQRRGEA